MIDIQCSLETKPILEKVLKIISKAEIMVIIENIDKKQ